VDNDGETYYPAPRLRRGWQLYDGDGWPRIRAVRVVGQVVLITVEDGRTFRAGYLDAVCCRVTSQAADQSARPCNG